jgi:hypothetical protein
MRDPGTDMFLPVDLEATVYEMADDPFFSALACLSTRPTRVQSG